MSARRVPILLYHSVCDAPAPLMRDWSVTPARFRDQMAGLRDEGFRTLTVSQFVERVRHGAALPERVVVITFDDGFADFESGALPALADHGLAATLYVSTAYVGARSTWLGPHGEQAMLSWSAIADLAAAGVEIGAHSHHHWALDELDRQLAAREIECSKQILEEHLAGPVPSFAYPHGYHTRRIQSLLRAAGFTSACGVKHAASSTRDDPFGLARIIVPPTASPSDLLGLMHGVDGARTRERARTKVWRAVRRGRGGTHADAAATA